MIRNFKKYYWILIIPGLIILYLASIPKIVYSAPTAGQVQDFIAERSLHPICVKEADDYTVVIYQNNGDTGHFYLYQDQNHYIYFGGSSVTADPENHPVVVGGTPTGRTTFVTLVINDEELLKQAKEAVIMFDDGTAETHAITGKGSVFIHENQSEKQAVFYKCITIFDENGKKIYCQDLTVPLTKHEQM